MSNWTKFNAYASRSHRVCGQRFPKEGLAPSRLFQVLALTTLAGLTTADSGFARDRGQYASSTPEMKAWFESLKSGKGPCCSDADGSAVADVDWKAIGSHYSVRLDGEWVDVPDDALIKEPNRVGRTMVWPIYREGKPVVRCFMPGSMT